MIWRLMKYDPVWSNRMQVAAISAVAAYFVPRVGIGLLAFLTWMPWLGSRPEQRAAPHSLGLPILARDLFLARFLALLFAMWTPLAIAAAVFLVTGRSTHDVIILAELAGGAAVVNLIALSSRVRLASGSGWMPPISQVIITAAAVPAHYFLGPLGAIALAASVAAGLFWNIWRQLPLAFEILPMRDRRENTAKATGATATPVRARFVPLAWMPVLRWVFGWRSLMFMPAMFMMGLSGNWLFLAIFCLFPISTALRVPWPFTLPIRRGTLLALALGPWMLVLFFTVAVSSLRNGPRDQDSWREPMKLPFEYWQFGRAQEIQAPWGERTLPETYRFLGLPIHNPYGAGRENSQPFVEWQFRRATQAIYGRPIAYEDYKRHRLPVPPLVLRAPFPALNLAACAFWVGLMTNLLIAGLHWRVRQITPLGQHVINGVFLLQMVLFFVLSSGVGTPWNGVHGFAGAGRAAPHRAPVAGEWAARYAGRSRPSGDTLLDRRAALRRHRTTTSRHIGATTVRMLGGAGPLARGRPPGRPHFLWFSWLPPTQAARTRRDADTHLCLRGQGAPRGPGGPPHHRPVLLPGKRYTTR